MRYVSIDAGGCWLWTGWTGGSKGRRPYFRPGTRASDPNRIAYRWLWEHLNGELEDGIELDHVVCQNRMCVNPAHLEPVPAAVNAERTRLAQCERGHDLTVEGNRIFDKRGRARGCRPCNRDKSREYQRQKAAAIRAAREGGQ